MSENKPKRMKSNSNKSTIENKKDTKKTKKNKKTRKRTNHSGVKKFLLFISCILIILLGIFTYKIYQNGWGLQGLLSTLLGQNRESLANLEPIDFLLIGESGNMTDTIIICTYNPKKQTASMLSVPRDTFVGNSQANATPSNKINCIYNMNKKDPMATVKAVNKVTGLNLKYYVFVDTDALTKLVDAIGGVEFDVPIDMTYDDPTPENTLHIRLNKGVQIIDGDKAEQLLRFRHNNNGTSYPLEYGDNDLGRMRTQREFIKATITQTLKAGNIFKLNEILDIAQQYTKTNLSIENVKAYIPYAVNFNTENLTSEMLPNTVTTLNKWSFVLLNYDEVEEIINDRFFGGKKEVVNENEKPITVELLNGSEDPEKLKKALDALEKENFDVVKVGNTDTTRKSSIINRTKQSNDIITSAKNILSIDSNSSIGKDNVKADLTITLGKDYE